MRRLAILVAAGATLFVVAGPAGARSFDVPDTEVRIDVLDDGTMVVTERLTYDFSGPFSGAFREIPLRRGESITAVEVSEGEQVYQPGGCTDLGCSSPPGTFGVRELGDRIRVVWHYAAGDEAKTFTVRYRATGVAKAYDDVVDVNWKVWGDEWEVSLERLTASMALPGDPVAGEVRVWGHPASVDGEVTLGPGDVFPQLEARSIPAGQFVELRVVFPRSELTSAGGASVVEGDGLDQILEEEQREAERSERSASLVRTLAALLPLLAIGPAALAGLVIYFRFGREPKTGYDREYEQEPPTELPPAEVGALLSQGKVDSPQFTATVFDLIGKGAIDARPVQVERSTWGGLKTENISDLELTLGSETSGHRDYEQRVMTVVKRALDDGPLPLHEFRDRIRDDASANASTYQSFLKQVVGALERRGKLMRGGRKWIGLAFVVWIVVGVGVFFLASSVNDSTLRTSLIVFTVIAVVANGVILAVVAASRRVLARRSKDGALEAARWDAFRRYLRDFSRMEEAPPISLDLWDKFLVYGITLGVAEEVLEAARIRAPAELHERSRLYWYGGYGYSGGSTENAFAGLNSALSGAFNPPSSSGGSGGGFSGGGGFGGGGGGGGAW